MTEIFNIGSAEGAMKPFSRESKIRKFKQIMNIGNSVNMALDLGQVEGGLLMRIEHHKSETKG